MLSPGPLRLVLDEVFESSRQSCSGRKGPAIELDFANRVKAENRTSS